jgi:hypothetical protein
MGKVKRKISFIKFHVNMVQCILEKLEGYWISESMSTKKNWWKLNRQRERERERRRGMR